ncbi:MAG: YrdB family protein [Cyclobacteriaceae bacterium]
MMLKYTNQILMFVVELIMVGSFSYFGYQKGNTTLMKYGLAIVIPAIAILLWGYWAAPKSTHRLSMPYLALFRGIMFLVAAYFLYQCNHPKFATILAILSVINQVVSYFTENEGVKTG